MKLINSHLLLWLNFLYKLLESGGLKWCVLACKRAPRLDPTSTISILLIRVFLPSLPSDSGHIILMTPLMLQPSYLSLSHSFFVSHTLSLCGAPMVTCGPSKQDKLSTHKSQQCACPLSLAHPAWQQKPHQRLPPPAHSNVSHLVWSRRLLCKSTVFLTSTASDTHSKQEL